METFVGNTYNIKTSYTMVSKRVVSFLSLFFTLIFEGIAKPDYQYHVCISENGDYGPNSTYHTNLNTVLSRLTNTKNDYGFYNASYGQDDRVYSKGLCRGDVTPQACITCLNNFRFLLLKHCPYQKRAAGGYDECMLQYSYRAVLGYYDSDFRVYLKNETKVSVDWDEYSYVLKELLSRLGLKAATTDSSLNRKFASGNATSPSLNSQTIYAAVQCTPDLTVAQCSDCLDGAFSEIPKCCNNKLGGVIIKYTCNLRYENFRFYESTADTVTLQLSPQGSPSPSLAPSTYANHSESTYHGKNNKSKAVIFVSIVVFVGLLIFICIYFRVRKPTKHFDSEAEVGQAESSQFDFDTIRLATNNFSDAKKLGQGGFGPVYKGKLFDGKEVAVKRLSSNSSQGDIEFKNEVQLMSRLQHRNLVRLLGFCFTREERLLVYEFLPNKSLDSFLFNPTKRKHLDWKTRYKIIEGIARGLLYLHEDCKQRIIHRDLKLSNILLDSDMNPKISDFGLARMFVVDQTLINASKIAGTYGYMAPEYARHGKLSMKSDVFSFGVMVLEIVSGQKNGGFRNGDNVEHLLSFAWKNWRKGTIANIIDPTLNNDLRDEIFRCIHIGLLCVQANVADRPTMASVILMLDSHSFALPVPLQPAFFMNDNCLSDMQFFGCSSVETGSNEQKSDSVDASTNEASISILYPR